MKHSEYSVVIVGSGAAGLYAALKIAEQINLPDGLLIISKSKAGISNSKYAQGGIVGVLHQNPQDNVESHVKDTLKAGAGLSEEKVVRYISENSDNVINNLMDYGIDFDKDSDGNLNFTLEAAHSCRRILHVGGDATGSGIVQGLVSSVKQSKDIVLQENSIVVELLINSKKECKGLILYNEITGEHEIVYASAVILATGGVGQLYKCTTNPMGATGDGIAVAYNAGADIQDMEFVQFHPTAFAGNKENKNMFLISEAVRGEGAKLVDENGQEFMQKYSEKRELAPRDVVTRGIFSEMKEHNFRNMFLNASIIEKTKLLSRFPTISGFCLNMGIDISKNFIPVAPAAHYTMGGIKAGVDGKTSIKGLYAIGEVASTGLHGANRLASNSLLECVVSAYELADYLSFTNLEIPHIIDNEILNTINVYSDFVNDSVYDIKTLKEKLKNIMWDYVGIIRNADDLQKALDLVEQMQQEFRSSRKCLNTGEYEYRNMLTVAKIIIESAMMRKESRGAHSRSDFPQTNDVAEHSLINNKTVRRIEVGVC